jgi:hypothetical protein
MDYSICIKEIKKECFGELWRNALENNLFSSGFISKFTG